MGGEIQCCYEIKLFVIFPCHSNFTFFLLVYFTYFSNNFVLGLSFPCESNFHFYVYFTYFGRKG